MVQSTLGEILRCEWRIACGTVGYLQARTTKSLEVTGCLMFVVVKFLQEFANCLFLLIRAVDNHSTNWIVNSHFCLLLYLGLTRLEDNSIL